jgi:hypothetical protein
VRLWIKVWCSVRCNHEGSFLDIGKEVKSEVVFELVTSFLDIIIGIEI